MEAIFNILLALLRELLDMSEVSSNQVLIGLGVLIVILLILAILGAKLWLIPLLKNIIIVQVPQNARSDETNTEIKLSIKNQVMHQKLSGSSRGARK